MDMAMVDGFLKIVMLAGVVTLFKWFCIENGSGKGHFLLAEKGAAALIKAALKSKMLPWEKRFFYRLKCVKLMCKLVLLLTILAKNYI